MSGTNKHEMFRTALRLRIEKRQMQKQIEEMAQLVAKLEKERQQQ